MKENDMPSKVQEYKNLEETEDGKPVWAFICPNPECEHENRLKGDPTKFMNRPFRCLNCNYVPLLGTEGIEKFVDRTKVKANKTEDEKGDIVKKVRGQLQKEVKFL